MWKQIESEMEDKEPTAASVKASLAEFANKCFKRHSDEKLKEKFDKIKRPENCDNLQVPVVNSKIWKKLPVGARKADLQMAQTQRALVKAAIAVVNSTQLVLHTDSKKKRNLDKKLNCSPCRQMRISSFRHWTRTSWSCSACEPS